MFCLTTCCCSLRVVASSFIALIRNSGTVHGLSTIVSMRSVGVDHFLVGCSSLIHSVYISTEMLYLTMSSTIRIVRTIALVLGLMLRLTLLDSLRATHLRTKAILAL